LLKPLTVATEFSPVAAAEVSPATAAEVTAAAAAEVTAASTAEVTAAAAAEATVAQLPKLQLLKPLTVAAKVSPAAAAEAFDSSY
jgi:hypothetical protein